MLYINGRFLTQKPTGVNRFAFEMCQAMKELKINFVVLAPGNIINEYTNEKFEIKKIGYFSGYLWEQFELRFFLIKEKCPLLISFTGLGPIGYKNHICTIHDLSFLVNPKWFSKSYYLFYKFFTPIVSKRSIKIITVSNFSKKEILRCLPIDEKKIIICPNALPKIFHDKGEIVAANQHYFLCVSSIDPRKNLENLIKSFIASNLNNISLYIVGKKASSFGKLKIEETKNIKWLGYVSDADLVSLYRNARAFIYPSFYEGFGIPPLEALSQDCPILISNIEVHKEIYGDSAIYFNPNSISEITERIKGLFSGTVHPNVYEFDKILSCYSWEKSAQNLINNIIELL